MQKTTQTNPKLIIITVAYQAMHFLSVLQNTQIASSLRRLTKDTQQIWTPFERSSNKKHCLKGRTEAQLISFYLEIQKDFANTSRWAAGLSDTEAGGGFVHRFALCWSVMDYL